MHCAHVFILFTSTQTLVGELVVAVRYLTDLGMAVPEVQLLNAVVYLLLPDHGQGLTVGRVQASVNER